MDIKLTGTRTGTVTVTRQDTGEVIGTVSKLNGLWHSTTPDLKGIGKPEAKRISAVQALTTRAIQQEEAMAEAEARAELNDQAEEEQAMAQDRADTTPTFSLTFTPPYEEATSWDLAQTLRSLAQRIEWDQLEPNGQPLTIRDGNGNTIGKATMEGEF